MMTIHPYLLTALITAAVFFGTVAVIAVLFAMDGAKRMAGIMENAEYNQDTLEGTCVMVEREIEEMEEAGDVDPAVLHLVKAMNGTIKNAARNFGLIAFYAYNGEILKEGANNAHAADQEGMV